MMKKMKKVISMLLCLFLAASSLHVNSLNVFAEGDENLALNKEVSASSSYNTTTFAVENAVDGDISTRWGNKYNSKEFNRGQGNTEETYTVNLGAVYEVATVSIKWEAAYATTYTIQGSMDGETFFDIREVTDGAGGNVVFYDFEPVETQYIRLAMHTCATQYGYSIWELEVYEATDSSALEAVIAKALTYDEESYTDASYDALYAAVMDGKKLDAAALQSEINEAVVNIQAAMDALEARYPNLALGKSVTASSTYSTKSVDWLVDGKTNNTWQINYLAGSDYNRGNGDLTEEVVIDLGAAYPVELVNIVWKSNTFAKTVKMEGSLDNVNFFEIKTLTDCVVAENKQVQIIDDLGDVETQYLRFSFSEPNNKTYGYEVYEIEVFEKNPASSVFTNIALNKNVVDDPTEMNTTVFVKEHLTDGYLSTRWGNLYTGDAYKENPTETFTLDLEDTYVLDRVVLNFEAAYAQNVVLQGSVDGEVYFDITTGEVTHDGETCFVDLNAETRYLRVVLSEPVGQYGFSLWEIEAYGSRAAELEALFNEFLPKFETIVSGNGKGEMAPGNYQKYSDLVTKVETLLEDEDASSNEMRKAVLALQEAFVTLEQDIINSDVLVSVYPTVQNLKYGDDEGMQFKGETVDILVHGEQDVATLPKVEELLAAEGYAYQVVDTVGENPAIVLAVKCDNDCEICSSVKDAVNALEHVQGYVLSTSNDVNANGQVTIVGADADGVYYGVMSFMQIVEQKTAEGVISEVVISDYPDTEFRGYVEGFYGFPWTTEERASLFEDTSKYKMTTYIYAPKDDPYHRDEWRALYPDEEAADIRELAAVAMNNNMDFCWTVHPGADYDYTTDSDSDGIIDDFKLITEKFDQVYSLGVRQFGIFYDDLNSSKMDGPAHAKLINDTYEYLTSKYDDVKPFITVTSKYNNKWGGDWNTYFTPFMEQVHEDTIVLWTGNHTMSAITKEYMEYPQTMTGVDRDLGVWWNYPVTDYCYGKLLMGSLDILSRDVDNINGFFLNPMSEADASKVAIFSGADYSWNIGSFDSVYSWERSIEELVGTENGVNKAFERFADNISYGSLPERKSNFEFDESKYLMEDIENFKAALTSGENLDKEAANLKEKFEQMLSDVTIMRENITNTNLLEEITLHLDAYESLAKSGIAAMTAYLAALEGDVETTIEQVEALEEHLEASNSVTMKTLSGKATVIVGTHRIQPLLKDSSAGILEILHKNMDYAESESRMITNVDGLAVKAVEKTGESYTLTNITASMNAGDYVTIALPEAMNIYEISTKAAPAENFKVQISLNGLSWEDVTDADAIRTGAYARLVCIADGTDAVIEKFAITRAYEPALAKVITDLSVYKNNQPNNAIDGSLATSFWSNSFATDGNYICVDLGAQAKLNTVELYNGINKGALDGYAGIQLEVSADGMFWQAIGDVKTIDDYEAVDETMKKLAYDVEGAVVRYFRFVASGTSETWTKVFEIVYDAEYVAYENHLKLETNMPVTEDHAVEKAMDNHLTTWMHSDKAVEADDYVSVDLGTIVPLYDASIYFGATEAFASVKMQTSADGKEWTDAAASVSKDAYRTESDCLAATFAAKGDLVRYIRFVAGEAAENGVSIYEIRYNQTAEIRKQAPSLSTSMTEYKPAYTIDKAMDGDMDTKFYSDAAQVKGDYVQVNFGGPIVINDYALWFSANPKQSGETDGFKEFQVQVSNDGSTWTDVGDTVAKGEYTLEDNGKYLATGEFEGVIAQYVRFTATAAYSSWLQIHEIEINKQLDFSELRYVDESSTVVINNSDLLEDKDISTKAQILESNDGNELVYPMTVHRDVQKIAVLQDVENISGAEVSVQAMDGSWRVIGTLDSVWTEFEIKDSILAVKFAFDGEAVIHEILVYGGADYIKVLEALETVPEDLSIYTEETAKAVTDAVAAVTYGKAADEQEAVDAMANAIKTAVAALEEKPEEGGDEVDASDDSLDVPVEMYTVSAGSAYGNSEGSAIDGNPNTFWEVEWDIGATEPEKLWYQIDMGQEIEIQAVRYLPRWGGDAGNKNGFVESYIIKVSTDGENWTDVAEGSWEMAEGWKIAQFDKAVTARYVKLVATGTYADVDSNFGDEAEVNSNMSIAEIRVKATEGQIVNKGALNKAIAAAEALVDEDYKDMSAVDAAYEAAVAVAAKADATQEEVDAAAKALTDAIAALVKVVKKAELETAIADAKAVDQTLYTTATAKALADAIAAGEALVTNEEATQAEVDAAAKAIKDAKKALVVKATAEETAALQGAVDEAKAMDTKGYTEESVEDLEEAIAAAEAVLAKAEATKSEVEKALAALEKAANGLDKVEVCEIYPDVDHGQWYEEFVQFVHDNDIMTGNKDTGMFMPNGNLLRQQFVMLLWNMEGKPVVEESEAFDVLVDADENGYYADALRWAYNEGIMTGVNGKYFQGDQPLKRQQLAKMLYEYAEKKGYDVSARADYSDMENADQVADYAKEYMAWAVGTGMITGKNGTDLAPMDTATRAAVAKIVKVFLEHY